MDYEQIDKKLALSFAKIKEEILKIRKNAASKEEFKELKKELKEIREKCSNEPGKDYGAEIEELKESIEELKNRELPAACSTDEFEERLNKVEENVSQLVDNAVEVRDVEHNFIARKEVEKSFEKFESLLELRNDLEKAIADIHDKLNSLRNEIDEINDTLSNLTHQKKKFATKEDIENTTRNIVKSSAISEVKRQLEKIEKRLGNMDISGIKEFEKDIEKIKGKFIERDEFEFHVDALAKKITSLREDMDSFNKD